MLRYMPRDYGADMFNNIKVTTSKVIDDNINWTVTQLQLKHMPSGGQRPVWHFFFKSWPDFGVPQDPYALVSFVQRVREFVQPTSQVPIVVHCSAGVGRTGTFIALDVLMQVYSTLDKVLVLFFNSDLFLSIILARE